MSHIPWPTVIIFNGTIIAYGVYIIKVLDHCYIFGVKDQCQIRLKLVLYLIITISLLSLFLLGTIFAYGV